MHNASKLQVVHHNLLDPHLHRHLRRKVSHQLQASHSKPRTVRLEYAVQKCLAKPVLALSETEEHKHVRKEDQIHQNTYLSCMLTRFHKEAKAMQKLCKSYAKELEMISGRGATSKAFNSKLSKPT